MQDRSPPTRRNPLATHGRTIHWVSRVGFAMSAATGPLIPRLRSRKADMAFSSSWSTRGVTTMCDSQFRVESFHRVPWNKGKLIGARPPLKQKHVWAIRTWLQIEQRTRDLALFNLAIDSKLRGCDLVAVRIDDVAPNGYAIERATVRRKRPGRPVRIELTEHTRQAVDELLEICRPQEARRVSICRSTTRTKHDDAAVCTTSVSIGCAGNRP